MNELFYKFCMSHCCRDDGEYRKRIDFCPLADKVKEKYGAVHGGYECEEVFYNSEYSI